MTDKIAELEKKLEQAFADSRKQSFYSMKLLCNSLLHMDGLELTSTQRKVIESLREASEAFIENPDKMHEFLKTTEH